MEDSELDQYSTSDITRIANVINIVAAEANKPWTILQRLGEQTLDEPDLKNNPVLPYAERALAYSFVDDKKPGSVTLGVRLSDASNKWPLEFKDVSPAEKQVWCDIANQCTHHLAKAHMLDVALSSGIIRGRDVAKEIADLYLTVAQDVNIEIYYRGGCLRRCWSIARSYGLHTLEAQARSASYQMAQLLFKLPEIPTGILLQPFEVLTVNPRCGEFDDPSRQEMRDLLKQIRFRSATNVSTLEGVSELLVRVASTDSERGEARRSLIESYLALGESAKGMIASSYFEDAARIANKYEYIDLRDRAVQLLQAVPYEDLGMQTLPIELRIPCYAIDATLDHYRHSRDGLSALDIWLAGASPTGSYESNVASAKESMDGSIIAAVTRTTFDGNMPTRTSAGVESAVVEATERQELINVGLNGQTLAHELKAIKHQYGIVTPTHITAHLVQTYRCDSQLALALGHAIVSFWDERYTDAGRAAFPLVEAGARGVLLLLGDPLYRIQTGSAGGHFPSLEKYAEKLEQHNFDIDWLRCIRNPVAKWRNALAHGHRLELADYEAAVLLRTAALLVILTSSNSSKIDKEEIDMSLRDPIRWAANQAKLIQKWEQVWAPVWEHKIDTTDLKES
jgi:hypothetical protein